MNCLELNLMHTLLEERSLVFEQDLSLFKMLDKIVQGYEKEFTKKYKHKEVHVMGSNNTMLIFSIEGDMKHRIYNVGPNAHLFYTLQKNNGKTISYHSSWITFK